MSEIADLRLAIGAARRDHEQARRRLLDVQVELRFSKLANLLPQVIDGLVGQIGAHSSIVDSAAERLRAVRANFDAAVADEPGLWEADADLPLLLLPVRLEAIFPEVDGRRELWLRVYPDDVHVDAHETPLTESERAAGERYWRSIWAAGPDPDRRATAWRTLLDTLGLARAAWVVEALAPAGAPPAHATPEGQVAPQPPFPDVPARPASWTRAAHTTLLPDHFVFSAYQGGRLAWRHTGKPIPDTLPVGFAPPEDGAAAPPDGLPWDEQSGWLVDFDSAVSVGMALKVRLEHPGETFDLLTVVGVTTGDDPQTGADRWQEALQAHQFSDGLAVLASATPTNNTEATRSGWRSRPQARPPEAIDAARASYDRASRQPAARAAHAFGIDGAPVLAAAPGALEGDEDLVAEVHAAVGRYYSLSSIWQPAVGDGPVADELAAAFDVEFLVAHFSEHVRSRGTVPALRIGRQPYGVLPATALDLWRGPDVDQRIVDHVGSFLTALEGWLDRVPQVGDSADQDAVILDLLSREPASQRVNLIAFGPAPSQPLAVGSVPADSVAAMLLPTTQIDARLTVDDEPPQELRDVFALRPLAAKFHNAVDFHTLAVGPEPGDPPLDGAAVGVRFDELNGILAPLQEWDGEGAAYTGVFYPIAEVAIHYLLNHASRSEDPNLTPEQRAVMVKRYAEAKAMAAGFVALEERALADLAGLDRVLCEVLDTLSHRVDAWATSVATARLTEIRGERPTGLRTGAYGWLTGVVQGNDDRASDGFIVTPSMHHATTAAVLRSGWKAHADKRALAVDLQSARVRSALTTIDGVRSGQSLGALLGYQFERGLHDAGLDGYVESFRAQRPLAASVEPDAPDSDAARIAAGARNVVDGQALRRDPPALDAIAAADRPVVEQLIAALDETIDAVGDLLLAESVHHLVGGTPLRAGLSADAIGRGEALPEEFDVIRTPRSASAVRYHLGLLGPPGGVGGVGGWSDQAPLARLEPALEGWCRARLGTAESWSFACSVAGADGTVRDAAVTLAALDWCCLDAVTAALSAQVASPLVRAVLQEGGGAGETVTLAADGAARVGELTLLCGQIRAVLAAGTPLLGSHLDPQQADGWAAADLDDLHARIAPWLRDVAVAHGALRDRMAAVHAAAPDALAAAIGAVAPVLTTVAGLGIAAATPAVATDVAALGDHVLARLDSVAPRPLAPPPDVAARTTGSVQTWVASATAQITALVGDHLKVVPVLRRGLPGDGAPPPGAGAQEVADWLRGITLVRPAARVLDEAVVATTVLGGGAEGAFAATQTPAAGSGAWVATAAPASTTPARSSIVLHHDGTATGAALAGLVVDSWSETIPRPAEPGHPGEPAHPDEIAGVAFHYDRPGSRAPQALLLGVAPDRARGWRMEDVHGVVEDTLTLARMRGLDLRDMPELRSLLPVPRPSEF